MTSLRPKTAAIAAGCACIAYVLYRRIIAEKPLTPEQAAREDLAAAHQLSAHFGFDELVWNHISARIGEKGNRFLVTSGRQHFDEVTPGSLVVSGSSNANVTADVIHRSIYEARPDVGAIVHHHTCATTTVACLKEGLKCLTQDSAPFFERVAYHDWEGLSDNYDECQRIQQDLGPECHTLVMRNHGVITTGRTVAEAWVRFFYLERICRVQVATLGQPVVHPPDEVLRHARGQYEPKEGPGGTTPSPFAHGMLEWDALRRLAARITKTKKISERPY